MKRHLVNLLAGSAWLMPVLLFIMANGCARSIFEVESEWEVPFPPSERPSLLWTTDSRTQGWNGVHVTYFLLGNGRVDADVDSTDHRHKFTVRGECWYENDKQKRCDAYPDGRFLVVRFGDKRERYLFEHRDGIEQGLITVVEPNSPSHPPDH
jgi:hypothetical protein